MVASHAALRGASGSGRGSQRAVRGPTMRSPPMRRRCSPGVRGGPAFYFSLLSPTKKGIFAARALARRA
jgi:hypothetical protein